MKENASKFGGNIENWVSMNSQAVGHWLGIFKSAECGHDRFLIDN